ncbi:hypothetical protein QFC21_004716 [Naganishia friedmannii]|uniref:Uncharacterized protein n=1 Tax=Naganishia friedmannii TaxID=89922 RepID=A0ACC2VFB9_9TREE|nr:hypothetical protein QFC21_004716 [Naganishia friedmannii]
MPSPTRLDQLSNLLAPATYSRQQYLIALQKNGQDVQRAAEWLLLADVDVDDLEKRREGKVAGGGLKAWLKPTVGCVGPEQRFTTKSNTEYIALDTSDDSDDERGLEILDASPHLLAKGQQKASPPPASKKRKTTMSGASFMAHLSTNHSTSSLPARRPAERAIQLRSNLLPNEASITYTLLPTLTLHRSPLPAALASALFLQLMKETSSFERHEWFLAGRYVKSPHTSRYYHSEGLERDDTATATAADGNVEAGNQYWYAGKQVQPAPVFPSFLQKAADLLAPFVNEILATRSRYPGEYAGEWKPSYAGVNHYQGAGSAVGWHADQLTYLGPYATIVSLSLGTPREFRLRPSTNAIQPSLDVLGHPLRTYAITLPHNSVAIMHAGTQELYKHTVVPHTSGSLDLFKPPYDVEQRWIEPQEREGYNSRINITFRFYREDFRPYPSPALPGGLRREGTPICRCGIPTILRADQKGKVRAARASENASSRPPAPAHTVSSAATAITTSNNKIDEQDKSALDAFLRGMVYFWQCQSSSITGTEKGCGFFRVLDMKAEGRGPCFGNGEKAGLGSGL